MTMATSGYCCMHGIRWDMICISCGRNTTPPITADMAARNATIESLLSQLREQRERAERAEAELVIANRVVERHLPSAVESAKRDADLLAAERTVREQREANGLLRSALYACRRAMQAAGLTQTEVARREVYEWLKAEGDESAAAEWYESALAALAPNTEGEGT